MEALPAERRLALRGMARVGMLHPSGEVATVMSASSRTIDDVFNELLARYGRSELQRRLELLLDNAGPAPSASRRKRAPKSVPGKRRSKRKSAAEYVEAMDVPEARKGVMRGIAKRFDEKRFLPTIADVRYFAQVHGVDAATFRSRDTTIPRLFSLLSSMDEDRLRWIERSGMFSGPADLDSLSDAIKEAGIRRRT